MIEKLLPCPFCGSPSEIVWDDEHHEVAVCCYNDGCGALNGPIWCLTEIEACESWNTRNHTPKYIATLIRMEAEEQGCGVMSVLEDVTYLLFPELRGNGE